MTQALAQKFGLAFFLLAFGLESQAEPGEDANNSVVETSSSQTDAGTEATDEKPAEEDVDPKSEGQSQTAEKEKAEENSEQATESKETLNDEKEGRTSPDEGGGLSESTSAESPEDGDGSQLENKSLSGEEDGGEASQADASSETSHDLANSQSESGTQVDLSAKQNEAMLSGAWPTLPKSGLRGWGLGVEVPMSGVLAGNATSSSHGLGYTLGFGLSFEVVRGWVMRLSLTGGETSRGEATIQYLDGGIPLTRSFEAEWLGVELGLGVQRVFKDYDPIIWPYVGLEAGPVFSGYFYRFDSAAVSTLATNDETTRYGANEYEAVGLGWAGKLSGGIRVELMPGLEWVTEYNLSLTTVSELEPVSNTRQIREVFPIQEWIFQHRLIIGLWLGL